MSILILNGYSPSQDPTRYEVYEDDVFSSNEQTEDGRRHVERALVATHKIAVGYTNLPAEDIASIKEMLDMDVIPTQYFDGAMVPGNFRLRDGTKTLKLKYKDGQNSFWDIEFQLEEV